MAARDQLLSSAEKSIAKGKLDSALKDYLQVLEENPRDISTLNRVGDLYVRMNRAADSIPFFTRIAEFCVLDGFFLKAIAIYKKINKLDPARLEIYDRLGDLYSKQGLSQDARSHFQVLADHYQKKGQLEEAIAFTKKMAALDPGDLRVQLRLADLYRSARQPDQAVMRYGLVGCALLRRGAEAEAASIFQKALELSPEDEAGRSHVVRSLLAQKCAAAALAIVRAGASTAESLALAAEAEFELGQKTEAAETARSALALDPEHEAARLVLWRIHLADNEPDRAYAEVDTVVDAALSTGDFARAAGYLEAILQRTPSHRGSLRKLAQVRESEGNAAEGARARLALAREEERAGLIDSAIENYRQAALAAPDEKEAARRLAELTASSGGLVPPPPSEEDLVLNVEGSASGEAPRTEDLASAEDEEAETTLVEAGILARYGLADRAVERLESLVRVRPHLVSARERLVELLAETKSPALRQEAEALANLYRERGEPERASALLSRVGLAYEPGALPGPSELFEEFPVHPAASATPDYLQDFDLDSARFFEPGPIPGAARESDIPAARMPKGADFASYADLPDSIENSPFSRQAGASLLDEKSLFAEEQQFFNLADELESELSDERAPVAPEMTGAEGEASLDDIFREFKKGVELRLSAEDFETHSNLGIAYREMGLIDEAIGEFQLASKDPARRVECCSMLGLCFLEKGMPQLAVKWYRKGLEAPGIKDSETTGLLYNLALLYQSSGETDLAYNAFVEVYGLNTNYRDVSQRIRELEAVRKN